MAKNIDKLECKYFAETKFDTKNVDWWIDSGLMAALVGEFRAGNCDDLASYAMAMGILHSENCTIALAQLANIEHSFVLVQSAKNSLLVLDTWVQKDRVCSYAESYWYQFHNRYKLTLHVAEVLKSDQVDITRMWYDWLKKNTSMVGAVRATDTPRTEQVGKYYHPSAKERSVQGL